MKVTYSLCKVALGAVLVFGLGASALRADDVLFVGNSFTFTGHVPTLVQGIVKAKGKAGSVDQEVSPGKNWDWHLKSPTLDAALKSKPWNWVVLQDYSEEPTHAGHKGEFDQCGAEFYDRIVQEVPQANIVLFETWAYDAKNSVFTGTSTAKAFANPDEMTAEIESSYTKLQAALQAKDPNRKVLLAPVGKAFALSIKEHPEINLFLPDHKHPSMNGSYLAALLIYAVIYQDTPVGAPVKLSGYKPAPEVAQSLQAVAAEALKP